MEAAEQPTAEALLTAFRTIKPAERARHAGVLDYWLSIRGDKEFPPLHDLDPLEISDAAPCSILLELIGGGQDAEIRHLGDAIASDTPTNRIIDAPNPSVLACIARKLPIVAISRDFLSFEESFSGADGMTRCWVTLLPLSSCGSWVDYVYAFVSVETSGAKAARPVAEPAPIEEAEPGAGVEQDQAIEAAVEAEEPEPVVEQAEVAVEEPAEPEAAADELAGVADDPEPAIEQVELVEPEAAADESAGIGEEAVSEPEEPEAPPARTGPGFAKLFEGFANLTGFYGQSVNIDPAFPVEPESEAPAEPPNGAEQPAPQPEAVEPEPADETEELAEEPMAAEPPIEEPLELSEPVAAEEPAPAPEPAPVMEGILQNKLSEVRAKADEARQAQARATAALHEGLSAAYDFALDAETSPEEYLRLVEAQGMKIQLRAPMAPVARLAFDGVCDAGMIADFETVLAWALRQELPRGTLLERIDQAGGISELLSEVSRPN